MRELNKSIPWRQVVFILFLSPVVILIELTLFRSAQQLLNNPSHDRRLIRASREILKNPTIRVVRIKCPEAVLQHSRGLATSMSLTGSIQKDGDLVKMWAVSRNAKPILIHRDIRYIDPIGLPTPIKSSLSLPFDPALLHNFLLIPQVIN